MRQKRTRSTGTSSLAASSQPQPIERLKALTEELARDINSAKVALNPPSDYRASVRNDRRTNGHEENVREIFERHSLSASHPEAVIEDICRLLETADRQSIDGIDTITHPATGLVYPPRPALRWAERATKYAADIEPEQFLALEYDPYCSQHLMFSDHLRVIDEGLHRHLRRKAEACGVDNDTYFLSLGVLSKRQTQQPPKGYERQASILRGVWMLLYAKAMRRTAMALIAIP